MTAARLVEPSRVRSDAQPGAVRPGVGTGLSGYVLFGVCALAPLPFGSTDAISLAVWCLALAIGLAFASPARLGPRRTAMLVGLGTLTVAFGLLLHEQASATPSVAPVDPVWVRSAAILGVAAGPIAATVRNAPLFAAGNVLACLGAVALGVIVGSDAARARRLLEVVAWSGLGYAAYGITSVLIDPSMILWVERQGYAGSVTGTFINRNTAAAYFGCCDVLWLLLLCESVRGRIPAGTLTWSRLRRDVLDRPPLLVVLRFGGTFVCFVALLMTTSRAGVLVSMTALAGSLLVFFRADVPRRLSRLQAVAITAVVALFTLQLLGASLNRRFEASGFSDEGRFDIYRATLRMIADRAWFGSGAGSFASAFPAYRPMPPTMWGVWSMAHSTPLETAAELGLPFTGLLACGFAAAFAILVYGVRARRRDTILPLAGVAVLLIALAHSSIDFSLQIPGFSIVVMALVGMGLAQSEPTRRGSDGRRKAPAVATVT